MAPEKGEKTAARGQDNSMEADVILDADQQGKNQGQKKQNHMDGISFKRVWLQFVQNLACAGSNHPQNGNGAIKKRNGLFNAGIGGADRGALGFIEMALAFHAKSGIDDIVWISL